MIKESEEFLERGRILLGDGHFMEAAKVCRLGLLSQPQLLEGRLILATALIALGRYEEVVGETRIALDIDERSEVAWLLRGEALCLKGDYAQSEQALLRVLEIEPTNTRADQLLTEVRAALDLGLQGKAPERTGTRLYPRGNSVDEGVTPYSSAASKTKVQRNRKASSIPPLLPGTSGSLRLPGVNFTPERTAVEATPMPKQEPTVIARMAPQIVAAAGGAGEAVPQSLENEKTVPENEYLVSGALSSRPATGVVAEITEELSTADINLALVHENGDKEKEDEAARVRAAEAALDDFGEDEPSTNALTPFTDRDTAIVRSDEVRGAPHSGTPTPVVDLIDELPVFKKRIYAIVGEVVTLLSKKRIYSVVGGVFALGVLLFCGRYWLQGSKNPADAERRSAAARQRLSSGSYLDYLTASEEYGRVLAERPSDEAARSARARLMAAMVFEFGDRIDPASREVGAVGDNASEDAALARAYLALSRGDAAKARTIAVDAQSHFKDAAPVYLVGRADLLADHLEQASEALAAAAKIDPRDPMIFHALGLAEAAQHHDALAIAAFSRALALSPNKVSSIVELAALQIHHNKDRAQAETSLGNVVTKLPGSASPSELAGAYLVLAQLEFDRNNLQGARTQIAAAAAKQPEGNALLAEQMASAYLLVAEPERAEAEARRAMSADHRRGSLAMARIALATDRPAEAIAQLGDSTPSETVDALVVRGRANLALGKYQDARIALAAALRQSPESVEPKVALAQIDLAEGRIAIAEKDLERLEGNHHSSSLVAESLGAVFAASNQADRARSWFVKATERSPVALLARIGLVRLDIAANRNDAARTELKRALAVNSDFAPALRELAALSFESFDLASAQKQYESILEKQPTNSEALIGAARVQLAVGDLESAQAFVDRAEKSHAPKEELADLRALLLLRANRPDDAATALRPLLASAKRAETAALFVWANHLAIRPYVTSALDRLIAPRLQSAPEMLSAQARIALEQNRAPHAEALATAAMKASALGHTSAATRADLFGVRARAYYAQGQIAAASRDVDSALKLNPKNAQACFAKALLLEDQQNNSEALKFLETAVSSDLYFAAAQYELGLVRARAKNPKASENFQIYLKIDANGPNADEARRLLHGGKVPPRPVRRKR